MRWLFRLVRRLILLLMVAVVGLLSPVAWVETVCRGSGEPSAYASILPEADRRPESRTLLTYPEWHIVHAYADYGAVIAAGDPHEFGYLSSIGGFWSSLCALSEAAPAYGGVDWPTKQMVYTIGVSFTAELLLKAAYEETVGRVFTLLRGEERAPLDELSARQAEEYAVFLQQVPWYKWDFAADAEALRAEDTGIMRDRERDIALGIEYGVKAAYAEVIAAAVASTGADQLTMRSVVKGLTEGELLDIDGVTIVAERAEGTEVETPRYRAFTDIARQVAVKGGDFVEIAGNDDILFTVITEGPFLDGALMSLPRQGNPGTRHLMLVKVPALTAALRSGMAVEHIHDY